MRMIRTLACALLSLAACDVPEQDQITDGDEVLGGPACHRAALDIQGQCRKTNGQVADASCCTQNIVQTDLALDVTTRAATATVTVKGSKNRSVVLEAGDLAVQSVTVGSRALEFSVTDGKLVIHARGKATSDWSRRDDDPEIAIAYGFAVHNEFDGFMDAPLSDMSFTWPDFCGNLFPCTSLPNDGIKFSVALTGVPEGQTAVYPASVDANAPSYMAAFAIGSYGYDKLGTTSAGTEVGVYYLAGGRDEAVAATATLTGAFEFYETTYGPYAYGDRVASVSVDWGDGDFGGMEHHPFWHIARGSMANASVHRHEAAHGWFGNGVRMKCREDFVLSEGTTSYLEARSAEATGTDPTAFWTSFQSRLERSIASRDFVVYPDGCNQIGSLFEIFTSLPYMKGAFFWRQVEHRVGRAALDAALSSFYRDRVGKASTMQQLIDHVADETQTDLADLETGWLKSTGVPCTLRDGDCVP